MECLNDLASSSAIFFVSSFFFYKRDKITKFYLVSDMEVFVDNILLFHQTKAFPRQNKVKNKVPE